MKTKKPLTNTKFLANLMDYGTPMKQLWIMDTLAKAAKADAFAPAPNWGENAWINADAWKAAATEIYLAMKDAGYAK